MNSYGSEKKKKKLLYTEDGCPSLTVDSQPSKSKQKKKKIVMHSQQS